MSTEQTPRVAVLPPVHERLGFTITKFGTWLVALTVTVLGGFLCATPVGVFLGLPLVFIGVLATVSFGVSISSTVMPDHVALPLVALCLVLFILGRIWAPIDLVEASFRVHHTLDKHLGPTGVFGIPLMLIGAHLFLLIVPWIRSARHMGMIRSVASLSLIVAGGLMLLVAAVMTDRTSSMYEQPWWAWPAVPAAFGLAVALRRSLGRPETQVPGATTDPSLPPVIPRTYGRYYAWAIVALLTGVTLPAIWAILFWRGI